LSPLRPLVTAGLLLLGSAAYGASDDPLFTWLEPPPDEQLAQDDTSIPLGRGALFVPTLSGSLNEPSALLVEEDDIRDIPTGERVLLEPGPYVVVLTSGSPSHGVGVAMDVVEGETTVVPVLWGGLRIEVTDAKRLPHRGSYDLIRVDTREPYGTGFGADTLQGESIKTWLLPPGLYRIVRQGANYRSLTNWMTIYVPEGGLVHHRLVMDPDTGEFLGGGQLMAADFGVVRQRGRRWHRSLVVGAEGTFVPSENVVGGSDQTVLGANVFIDGHLAYNRDAHHVTTLIQAEAGGSQLRPVESDFQPWLKSTDRVQGDLLYAWYIRPRVGPYVRGAGEPKAFSSYELVTEDTDYIRIDTDGTESEVISRAANSTFAIADPWAPTILREGVGINTRIASTRTFTLSWRVGFGLRQNLYAGAYQIEDVESTPEIEYQEIASFNQEGIESTIVASAVIPVIGAVYSTDLELFGDFETLGQPSIEWRNTVSVRLTRYLSLNYTLNIDRLPQVDEEPLQEQSVLLRASWDLL